MKITKEFRFEAAHQLLGDYDYGLCNNLHGHSYKMFVTLEGIPKNDGMIMNFVDLKRIVNESIVNKVDHTFLNGSFNKIIHYNNIEMPECFRILGTNDYISTCESMCYVFCRILVSEINETNIKSITVKLFETETSSCEETLEVYTL